MRASGLFLSHGLHLRGAQSLLPLQALAQRSLLLLLQLLLEGLHQALLLPLIGRQAVIPVPNWIHMMSSGKVMASLDRGSSLQ